ncbi:MULTISPECIES: branched-chain amino acid ABC transporter permease [unclassified Thauera]|uniref:branched-chain amino acid ABC transporter permease n=1 Tax=unclassified Thauera TaxID=2609274 RepID=UPI000E8D122E|nr:MULTISPECIES: branched-chain amino acid ABC transporter permease [unclassified Thauera]WBL62494.1 branched-chain amino acid ABC transporter permease [Thauera sp. WB-2]HAY09264.1 branched-chain amino acid ABC transporter permease [Thauera sp.]HNR61945.1 branched-chain amino acid ABC transporter permease [Thauera sp.]HNS93564.1 branched-chain amino acid ABC transporter permease [Thauera sp.]HRJ23955.1 branched-chain amino acid ABC transporter permease [Thauera sp.]
MNVNASLIVKLIAVAAIACVPMSGESFYVELVAKMLLMAIFAMSLDLLVGFTGLVSFGHAAYFGIAAYSVALFTAKFGQMSLWVMLPAAILLSAAAALVIGIFVIRTKGIYFIMVTLAFAQMAYFVFHDTPLGGGSDGVYVDARPTAAIGSWVPFDLDNELHMFYFVLVMMLLVYLFLHRVLQSPFGRVLMGIKSNEHRMQSLGYFTFGYKLAAFTLAGALGGVAGFLYAVLFGFVTPELLSWHESGNVLLMVILGGMGNLAGAVLGAFAFEAMREFFADITKYWQLLMGGVIVALVLFLPGGLTAIPGRIKRALQGGGAK